MVIFNHRGYWFLKPKVDSEEGLIVLVAWKNRTFKC